MSGQSFHSDMLEESMCPVCQLAASQTIVEFPPFNVVQCVCGLVFQTPRLKEIEMKKIYSLDSYYLGVGYSDYKTQEKALRITFAKLLKHLHEIKVTGGSLADVGCGFGYFLDEAKDYFHYRLGTDYSEVAIKSAKEYCDLAVLGGLDQIDSTLRFDCIVINQVIEHIYEPISFLENLKNFLSPNGRLVVITPNFNSPIRSILGKKWPSYKIPEHVLYFSQITLHDLLYRAGFSKVNRLPYPQAFPLSLIFSKFDLKIPACIGKVCVWIPSTSICAIAQMESS